MSEAVGLHEIFWLAGQCLGHTSEVSWTHPPSVLDTPAGEPERDVPVRGMVHRGTSLIKKRLSLRTYSRPMPRLLWRSCGGGRFPMREVPLYRF